jgi:hypothetical protein
MFVADRHQESRTRARRQGGASVMKKIEAVIRPHLMDAVKNAL